MNKKGRMYLQIENHGEKVIDYFHVSTDLSPIELSKKLFRLENRMHKACEYYCNGDISEIELDKIEKSVLVGVKKLLRTLHGIFVNQDPRGCVLKIKIPNNFYMRDWGGYGILAPNFTERDK